MLSNLKHSGPFGRPGNKNHQAKMISVDDQETSAICALPSRKGPGSDLNGKTE
jgi:hypothetical protein